MPACRFHWWPQCCGCIGGIVSDLSFGPAHTLLVVQWHFPFCVILLTLSLPFNRLSRCHWACQFAGSARHSTVLPLTCMHTVTPSVWGLVWGWFTLYVWSCLYWAHRRIYLFDYCNLDMCNKCFCCFQLSLSVWPSFHIRHCTIMCWVPGPLSCGFPTLSQTFPVKSKTGFRLRQSKGVNCASFQITCVKFEFGQSFSDDIF